MGEEALVGPLLSEDMVKAGEELLLRLDEKGIVVNAALWRLAPESGVWRLVLAIPEVRQHGPRAVYKKVQRIIEQQPSSALSLGDVSVVDTHDPLIQLFRVALQTGRGISGIRFSRNTINGVFIPDAYVYRVA